MGEYTDEKNEPVEGTVIVDGNVPLTTERLQDYVAFGPKNEVYLSNNMSVAFEICSSVIPSDVQIQLKKSVMPAPRSGSYIAETAEMYSKKQWKSIPLLT